MDIVNIILSMTVEEIMIYGTISLFAAFIIGFIIGVIHGVFQEN